MTDTITRGTGRTRPEDELLPPAALLGYGLQHIMAMFGGVIAVPLIIGGAAGLSAGDRALLVSCALFVSGLATLLQTIGVPFFGSQLPLVQGISFASVSTMLAIVGEAGGGEKGLRTVFGAVIVAALVGVAISPFFAQVVRIFPPLVTGIIITTIGLSLLPTAIGWITGQATTTVGGKSVPNPDYLSGANLALAFVTLALVLAMTKTPVLSRLAILLGLVFGTVIALIAGKAGFSSVGEAKLFGVPTPFAFGTPLFTVGAILSMVVVMIVIMVETTADILAVGEVVGTHVDSRRIGDGVRADMISTAVAPVFNSFPATAFAQNVGIVALTGVRSRWVVATGGAVLAVLAVLGLSPVLAAIVNVIPSAVLGGAGIVLFGSVAASGIRTLGKVDYAHNNNMVVVAVSLGFGFIPLVNSDFWSRTPDWFSTVFDSEISAAAIAAVVLNLFFNVLLPGQPPEPTDVAAAPATMVREDEAQVLSSGGAFEAGKPVDGGE